MKHLLYILLLFLSAYQPLCAQKKQKEDALATADKYIQQFLFSKAEQVITKDIEECEKRRKATTIHEEKLEEIDRLRTIVNATERVMIIDSVVVDKNNFIKHVYLGEESGELIYDNDFFSEQGSDAECVIYKPEIGERIWFAKPDSTGAPKLHYSDYEDNDWGEHKKVSGLNNDSIQNYPFMMADGQTLYYAAQGEECIGGYDIFITRYDADNNEFLQPENIGMPFNSTANDYMMAIDEYNQLGWFASDRNQLEGKVCIYVFIPNSARKQYDTRIYTEEEMARYAQIHSIAETCTDQQTTGKARERLITLRNTINQNEKIKEFTFVINDELTYHHLNDFKSPEAKELMAQWIKLQKEVSPIRKTLKLFRDSYAKGDATQKNKLTPHIENDEVTVEKLDKTIKQLTKQIRNVENNFLNK